jgi:circadian clock protein KaiC
MPTGIAGFDQIANGGLPIGRSTLVAGTAGSGKTLLAMQFLAEGYRQFAEPGVCVSFEENPADLMENVRSFGWEFEDLVAQGHIAFVDGSPEPGAATVEAGAYDLSALMARIENAVRSVGAKRVAVDAVGALLAQFKDPDVVRAELHRINQGLRLLGVTSLITIERTDEEGSIGRLGVEEFVADNDAGAAQSTRDGEAPPHGRDSEVSRRHASQGRVSVHKSTTNRASRSFRSRRWSCGRSRRKCACRPVWPSSM